MVLSNIKQWFQSLTEAGTLFQSNTRQPATEEKCQVHVVSSSSPSPPTYVCSSSGLTGSRCEGWSFSDCQSSVPSVWGPASGTQILLLVAGPAFPALSSHPDLFFPSFHHYSPRSQTLNLKGCIACLIIPSGPGLLVADQKSLQPYVPIAEQQDPGCLSVRFVNTALSTLLCLKCPFCHTTLTHPASSHLHLGPMEVK